MGHPQPPLTIAQLVAILANYPQDCPVYAYAAYEDFGPLNVEGIEYEKLRYEGEFGPTQINQRLLLSGS